jgi:DNA-directed RNA polymerase specialized sigma24 family protein
MAEAFAESARFQTTRALMPWLKSLAFHCAIDSVRKASRRAERERLFVECETLTAGNPVDRSHRLAPALAALNAEQRALIERRYFRGESSDEIAASEGRNRTAVAVEIHRICRRMRKACEESLGYPTADLPAARLGT